MKTNLENNDVNIVLATNNAGKVKQFKELFSSLKSVNILTTADVGFNEDIEETGQTFAENSEIKAKVVENHIKNHTKLTNYVVFSEDGGLCIDYLNGEPGVITARYGGESLGRKERLEYVLNKMKNANNDERNATFVAVISAILPTGEMKQYTGFCKGRISQEIIKLNHGLGMAPIFILDANNKALSELSDEELIALNHRGNATRLFVKDFNNFVLNKN